MNIEVSEIEMGMIIKGLVKMQRYLESPKCTAEANKGAKKYAELAKKLYMIQVNYPE